MEKSIDTNKDDAYNLLVVVVFLRARVAWHLPPPRSRALVKDPKDEPKGRNE